MVDAAGLVDALLQAQHVSAMTIVLDADIQLDATPLRYEQCAGIPVSGGASAGEGERADGDCG